MSVRDEWIEGRESEAAVKVRRRRQEEGDQLSAVRVMPSAALGCPETDRKHSIERCAYELDLIVSHLTTRRL